MAHELFSKKLLNSLQEGHLKYTYKGIPMNKCPLDLALYSLLIWNLKPKTIFEIGSFHGGSALWLSHQLHAFDLEGVVFSIDVNPPNQNFPDVVFLKGNAGDLAQTPMNFEDETRPYLVIEDASHQKRDTKAVLDFFDPILKPGEYVIVEDGIITELEIDQHFGGGPKEAIKEFLTEHPNYQVDRFYTDYFGPSATWNTNGYLKKVS